MGVILLPNPEKPQFSESDWNVYFHTLYEYLEIIYETLKTEKTQDSLIYEMIECSVFVVINALFQNNKIDQSKVTYK